MNIILCHGYHSHATSVYFERALSKKHNLYYVGTPWKERPGRSANEDVHALVEQGDLPRPDLVLFMESGLPFFPRGLERMECPTAGYLIDVHTNFRVREDYAPFFDHIFVAHKDYVGRIQQLGFENVHWMPVGCDPEIHGQIATDRVYDIGFVGNLAQSTERRRLLLDLERRYRMNDFRRSYQKEELTGIYSASKIAFNYAINRDVNMRVFEAMAAGALLVTNRMENGIYDLLRPNEHFVEFDDDRSLIERLDYFLSHEAERRRIAEAGKDVVIARHTYERRCEDMLETIRSPSAPSFTAKARGMSPSELRSAYVKVYRKFGLVDPALDELAAAWKAKEGRWVAATGLARTLVVRLNGITGLSQLVRGRLGRRK